MSRPEGRLSGRTAIVTGGARGIGAAAVRRFVAEGARVALADLDDARGSALAAEFGEDALYLYLHLDVGDESDWASGIAEVEARFGALDVLLNNACVLDFGSVETTSVEAYMSVVRVNQLGVFLGMRAVAPAMTRAGGGSIINISSVEGLRGAPDLAAYAASKWAVRGMTKVAAVELGPRGIRVNSIHPGAIDTPMLRSAGLEAVDLDWLFGSVPLCRAGRPDDVVGLALYLASEESSYCTGAEFTVDGGATAFIGWGGPRPRRP